MSKFFYILLILHPKGDKNVVEVIEEANKIENPAGPFGTYVNKLFPGSLGFDEHYDTTQPHRMYVVYKDMTTISAYGIAIAYKNKKEAHDTFVKMKDAQPTTFSKLLGAYFDGSNIEHDAFLPFVQMFFEGAGL